MENHHREIDTDTFKITVRYMDGKETIFPRATFDMLKFTIEEVVLPGLAIITRIERVGS